MDALGTFAVALLTGMLVLSVIEEWLLSKAVDWMEGEDIPHRRWFGLFRRYRLYPEGHFDGYGAIIRLPSYAWENDFFADRFSWHQRALIKQPWHGWKLRLIPITEATDGKQGSPIQAG